MRGGQRPVPTALKIIRGNPGRRPLPKNEFQPAKDRPACPAHLKGEARKEWRRLVKDLEPLLTRVDRTSLANCCLAWGRIVEAQKHIDEEGAVILNVKGYKVKNPWLEASQKAMDAHYKYVSEFGLSPCARTRIVVPQKSIAKKPDDKGWDQFATAR